MRCPNIVISKHIVALNFSLDTKIIIQEKQEIQSDVFEIVYPYSTFNS